MKIYTAMNAQYRPQRDPKPRPNPVCQHNCGPVPEQGHWRNWTCPCGYGYFRDDGSWVSGNHVRNGNEPAKDQQHTTSRSELYPPCPDCVSPKAVHNVAGATDSDPRSIRSPPLQPQSPLGGPQHNPWGNDDILSTNSFSLPRSETYSLNSAWPMPPREQGHTQPAQTPSYQAGFETTRSEGYSALSSYAPFPDTEASEPVSTYHPLAPETGHTSSTSSHDYLDPLSSCSTSSHAPDDVPQVSQFHQQESQTPFPALPPTGTTYGPRPIVRDDLPRQEDRRRDSSTRRDSETGRKPDTKWKDP